MMATIIDIKEVWVGSKPRFWELNKCNAKVLYGMDAQLYLQQRYDERTFGFSF